MPEDVSLDEQLHIITVHSYGEISSDDMHGALDEVKRIHEETGIDRVLVDVREQTARPSTIDAFEFYSILPRTFRIAILSSKEYEFKEDEEFADNITTNRGIVYKIFLDLDLALDWLGVK